MPKFIEKNLMRCVLLFITVIFSLHSCRKNDNSVPDVHVDITINVNEPQFVSLNVVGGWVYITGGSRGIIVYRRSNDQFTALERHCTFDPEKSSAYAVVDSTNLTATDQTCGSAFQLYDGAVTAGPANKPLKQYHTSFDGMWVRIYN
jgi:nitrite reductase/ring-hydroxylating ferredoxin subunit